jgi:hypothetical protein
MFICKIRCISAYIFKASNSFLKILLVIISLNTLYENQIIINAVLADSISYSLKVSILKSRDLHSFFNTEGVLSLFLYGKYYSFAMATVAAYDAGAERSGI